MNWFYRVQNISAVSYFTSCPKSYTTHLIAALTYVDHTCLGEDFYTLKVTPSGQKVARCNLSLCSNITPTLKASSSLWYVDSRMFLQPKAVSVQPGYSCSYLISNKTVSLYFDVHIGLYSISGIAPLVVHRKLWRNIEMYRGEFLLAHFHGAKWRRRYNGGAILEFGCIFKSRFS